MVAVTAEVAGSSPAVPGNQMAQLSTFLFNSALTSRNRYQSPAGFVAAFIGAPHPRHLHASSHDPGQGEQRHRSLGRPFGTRATRSFQNQSESTSTFQESFGLCGDPLIGAERCNPSRESVDCFRFGRQKKFYDRSFAPPIGRRTLKSVLADLKLTLRRLRKSPPLCSHDTVDTGHRHRRGSRTHAFHGNAAVWDRPARPGHVHSGADYPGCCSSTGKLSACAPHRCYRTSWGASSTLCHLSGDPKVPRHFSELTPPTRRQKEPLSPEEPPIQDRRVAQGREGGFGAGGGAVLDT